MRTFYLFEIKQNILKNYKYHYGELYSILESIYNRSNEDIVLLSALLTSIFDCGSVLCKNLVGAKNT